LGQPRGGAASMGYADLVVRVEIGGRWSGLGFQRDTPISVPRSLHFIGKREKKNWVFCLHVIFLL